MLAGVSLDYYARLEQGRDLQPSDQVRDAIARALRLAEVERLYLHNVIRSTATAAPEEPELAPLDAGTRTMLHSLQTPAFVIDLRGDIHWMNRLGSALLVGLEPMPSDASNHPRWLLCEESTRVLLTDWEMNARAGVGTLREAAGRYPHDPRLQALIGELSVASPQFRSWWLNTTSTPAAAASNASSTPSSVSSPCRLRRCSCSTATVGFTPMLPSPGRARSRGCNSSEPGPRPRTLQSPPISPEASASRSTSIFARRPGGAKGKRGSDAT